MSGTICETWGVGSRGSEIRNPDGSPTPDSRTRRPAMFRRIANLFRGFLSLFIGGMERQNPEALLAVEKENIRKQIANYNQGLAAHAGLCERLMTQVKRLEQEERELRAKTAANLRAGNRDLASQQALRLQTVQRELVEN